MNHAIHRWTLPRRFKISSVKTSDGRLRHPAWRGQRDDKNPNAVTKE